MPRACIPSADERARHQALADLLIPVVKGWCTENSVEVASLGVQVHGGMGFIEETGVAQQFRDSRITPIYEGTTAIQANDLVGRKLARDPARRQGVDRRHALALGRLAKRSRVSPRRRRCSPIPWTRSSGRWTTWSPSTASSSQVSVGAVPLLKLFGIVAGGWQLLRSAAIARRAPARAAEGALAAAGFYRAKIETALFYAHHVLSQAPGLAHSVVHGAAAALAEGVL